ncbi:MAG TPA: FkbM family methyltransferase [Verrucomicrobiae bacterium]|jgi:FkbM family methyltransferase
MNAMLQAVKHGLKILFMPLMVTIRDGPLKGRKWIATSGSKFVRGTYESYNTQLFADALREGQVVFDVGAHVGYYTAIASLRVGPKGRVFSFEPRPINLKFLRRHIKANDLGNVSVTAACVGDKMGEARFDTNTGTGTGHIADDGDLGVDMVCLDELVKSGRLPAPNFMKIDVEGAEQLVLAGAEHVINSARPTMLISTHGDDNHEAVLKYLDAHSYTYELLDRRDPPENRELFARPKA